MMSNASSSTPCRVFCLHVWCLTTLTDRTVAHEATSIRVQAHPSFIVITNDAFSIYQNTLIQLESRTWLCCCAKRVARTASCKLSVSSSNHTQKMAHAHVQDDQTGAEDVAYEALLQAIHLSLKCVSWKVLREIDTVVLWCSTQEQKDAPRPHMRSHQSKTHHIFVLCSLPNCTSQYELPWTLNL